MTQEETARLLGVCERTLRRQINRNEDDGIQGLIDKRLAQASHRRAPVDEVMLVTERYLRRHMDWNAKHYFAWYRRDGGKSSYTWVSKNVGVTPIFTVAASFSGSILRS